MRKIRLAHGVYANSLAIALSGAGAYASATGTNLVLQAVGFVSMALGLVLLVWGVTIDGELWWKPRMPRDRTDPVKLAGWVPMHLALRFIALRSIWGFSAIPASARQMEDALHREVLERLARGELTARGREQISESPYKLTATSVQIPSDFWQTAFFQPFGEIVLADDKRGAVGRDGSYPYAPRRYYREVVLDMTEVLKIWPKTPDKVLKSSKSPYHYALINHWKGEIFQDGGFATDVEMWVE